MNNEQEQKLICDLNPEEQREMAWKKQIEEDEKAGRDPSFSRWMLHKGYEEK